MERILIFLIALVVTTVYEQWNLSLGNYRYNLTAPLYQRNWYGMPLINPLAWAFVIAVFWPHFWLYILFDLFYDPAAVSAGWWKYRHGGIWFGVPLSNFFDWTVIFFISGGLWLLLYRIF